MKHTMKMKSGWLVAVLLVANSVFSQTLEDGKKMLYYERYESAETILEKIASANPANGEAVYYLAQAWLGFEKPEGARAILKKGNANDPLVLVGLGQMDLLDNKPADAKMKFETAISLTKGKNKNVLNAIARACVDAKAGDAQYGVDVLKPALANETKVAEYFVTLGDCYRKLIDGSNAIISYQKALEIQPNNAAALYKSGRVYKTQNNKEVFLDFYERTLKADPTYAPVLYELYSYWYNYDVNKATEYFTLYKKVADQGPALDYEEASLLYASKRFDDAISRALQLQSSQGANADVRLSKLLGYAYYQKADSVNSKKYLDEFFARENPDKIVGDNYSTYAKVLAKFRGSEDQAALYYDKAIAADTTLSNKIDFLREKAVMFKTAGKQADYCNTMLAILNMSKVILKTDLYFTIVCKFTGEQYTTSDSLAAIYSMRWPNEIYGHYYQALSKWRIDSTMTMGMANPHWFRYIEVAQKDSNANKRGLITAYNYMVGYNINVLKNKDSALYYATRMQWLDPTNKDAEYYIKVLTTPQKPAPSRGGANKAAAKPVAAIGKKTTTRSIAKN